jgi:hypothetical protein
MKKIRAVEPLPINDFDTGYSGSGMYTGQPAEPAEMPTEYPHTVSLYKFLIDLTNDEAVSAWQTFGGARKIGIQRRDKIYVEHTDALDLRVDDRRNPTKWVAIMAQDIAHIAGYDANAIKRLGDGGTRLDEGITIRNAPEAYQTNDLVNIVWNWLLTGEAIRVYVRDKFAIPGAEGRKAEFALRIRVFIRNNADHWVDGDVVFSVVIGVRFVGTNNPTLFKILLSIFFKYDGMDDEGMVKKSESIYIFNNDIGNENVGVWDDDNKVVDSIQQAVGYLMKDYDLVDVGREEFGAIKHQENAIYYLTGEGVYETVFITENDGDPSPEWTACKEELVNYLDGDAGGARISQPIYDLWGLTFLRCW